MRPITMFILAVVAVMAFVSVSTASANSVDLVLCKKAELSCTDPWPNPTEIHFHAEDVKLLSSLGTILCELSLALLTLLNKLSELLLAHVLELSFSKCKLGETTCTITVNEVGALSFVKSGPLEAAGLLIPLESANTSFTVKCGFFVNCTAGGETESESESTEGGLLHWIRNDVPLKEVKGFLCPETLLMDANYLAVDSELNPVHNLYLES